MPMTDANALLLKANLKQLKLPTMLAEWEKLAREAADRAEAYDAYLLRLTELELATRAANAMAARIRAAGSPRTRSSTRSTSRPSAAWPSRRCWSWPAASGSSGG